MMQVIKAKDRGDAIKKGMSEMRSTVSKDVLTELEGMQSTLGFTFYDKEKLDEIIDRADNIFQAQGWTV